MQAGMGTRNDLWRKSTEISCSRFSRALMPIAGYIQALAFGQCNSDQRRKFDTFDDLKISLHHSWSEHC